MQTKIIVLGDTHFPFHHKKNLMKALEAIKRFQPKVVAQIGDLYDLFSLTRFPRSHDIIRPADEIAQAREQAEDMWRIVKNFSPNSKRIQILGNHDIRYKLRLQEALPELLEICDLSHLWKFKGVKTHFDLREPLIVEKIALTHGHKTKLGDTAKLYGMPTIVGHSHRGGCVPVQGEKGKIVWELNAGYLGDPNSKVMTYTKDRWSGWTNGYGLVDEIGPRFVRL